jgi:hypothetical protein
MFGVMIFRRMEILKRSLSNVHIVRIDGSKPHTGHNNIAMLNRYVSIGQNNLLSRGYEVKVLQSPAQSLYMSVLDLCLN